MATTIAVVVALVAVTLGLLAGSGTASRPPLTPNGIVLLSARTALADRTAKLGISMALHTSTGATVSAAGSGAVDFTNDACQLDVTYSGAAQVAGMQLHELFVGGSFYLSMPAISTVVPGKSWVSGTTAGTTSITPGSSDPASVLTLLAQEGDSVRPAGSTAIDGVAVRAYDVEITPNAISRRLRTANLPAGVLQQVKGMFGRSGLHLTVYVGQATNLIRRITIAMNLSLDGATVNGTVTEDLTNYGVPVVINAPPASQVISLQQFEVAAANGIQGIGQTS
jgi:hypothetical protein